MADIEKISFIFKSASTLNLEDMRLRTGSPDLRHLYATTLVLYRAFLEARDAECPLVMMHPDFEYPLEIDDEEDPDSLRPWGIVTFRTDLSLANELAAKGGFTATSEMLTRAFILRERVTEAFEKGGRVGFFDPDVPRLNCLKRTQFYNPESTPMRAFLN